MKWNGTGRSWDLESDVVIVGYGYAGAVASIAAHDSGARVLLLEKQQRFGGISITSGGGAAVAEDAEMALEYLIRTNLNTTPVEVLRAYAEGLVWLPDYLHELGKINGARFDESGRERGGTYPFPGGETLGSIKVSEIPGFSAYPWLRGLRGGARLFKLVEDNVNARKIETRFGIAARQLLTDDSGQVVGLLAAVNGHEIAIRSRRTVILACGGFEFSSQFKLQHFELQPVYGVCGTGNTGDGIVMAQELGASLWHMWHFHGGYGFKFPEYPIAFRNSIAGPRKPIKLGWIVVNRTARRFMNEYQRASQDTGARALGTYEPEIQDFPNVPCFLIFDDAARRMGPIAQPIADSSELLYDWSTDNAREVDRGWITKGETLSHLASQLGLPATQLEATVDQWNTACKSGSDPDFGRLKENMVPVSTPPFFGIPAWPLVSNTQGGPVHDSRQRVLDALHKPIPRLYACGELGSLFGHLYLESGNNAECFIGGRIAGEAAAAETPTGNE